MAVKFKDYYETLGVSRTATPEELKKAFRKQARVHHPDTAADKTVAEEKFKEINEAYDVLSDPAKRQRYDQLGANWQDAAPQRRQGRGGMGGSYGPEDMDFEFGGTGYSDFFETFFGGTRGGHGPSRRRGSHPAGGSFAQRGQDVEADILVPLDEVLKGAQRKITLRRSGGGHGQPDTYQVRIPAGVREGQLIRLSGQGGPGAGGASAGDLYLRVRLAAHPDFTVKDSDLHLDLDLAPWEAVLGVEVKIPTLDGETRLKVSAGTSNGSQLRLRGLGLPRQEGGRGDLYATIRIQTPATVSDEERAAWEELRRVSNFQPRS